MLTGIYSPLQQLKHPSGPGVWVKRDDLIDPYISGNKWRKLKYILSEARAQNKNHIITFGGAYSNHLVATASACARGGLKCTAFVRGESVENEMLMLGRLFGMQLIFTSREEYQEKHILFSRHFGEDQDAFFVDEGGAGISGTLGCAEIIAELPEDVDHLFCAAGTGTTAAGLLRGIHEAGLKTVLHVVPVLKGGDFIAAVIHRLCGTTAQLELHTDYHFGGYAKTRPELISFIRQFVADEGILVDPVYTGKLFFAVYDLLGKGCFEAGAKIVALHTGGLLGIMGMRDRFRQDG